METSPDISTLLTTVETKPRQPHKPKLDPSVILQEGTKRERREPKKFVAKTAEMKEQSDSDEVSEDYRNLDDSYTKWFMAKASKRKSRVPKKPKGQRSSNL